jgi:pimeloyl-ACP methyl ester carboxylesterase
MPDTRQWNGDLIVFAHGMVPAFQPVHIPEEHLRLPDGTSIPDLANALGYGFAVSSFSRTGFAVAQALQELVDLVAVFSTVIGPAAHVYIVGPSAGGLIAALLVERRPDVFTGGLAACGYVGDLWAHLEYLHDVRVLFDYFFPGTLSGNAVDVPDGVLIDWDTTYKPAIYAALASDLERMAQIYRVLRIPAESDLGRVIGVLAFLLGDHATTARNMRNVLRGQAYDNSQRIYTGSSDDVALNAGVARFTATPEAMLRVFAFYTTKGRLTAPLVTIHTIGDPAIPYWQEPVYRAKVVATGSGSFHLNIPIARDGHCNVKAPEILAAFLAMVNMANPPVAALAGEAR